jgi:hypothetical protein
LVVIGSCSCSSSEAYLNDIYREDVLANFGFKLHRIWSTNWWRDPVFEKNEIITFIKNQELNFINKDVKIISKSFLD